MKESCTTHDRAWCGECHPGFAGKAELPAPPPPLVRPYAQLRQMLWDFEQAEGRRVMREKDMRHANALLIGPHQYSELRADPEFFRAVGVQLTSRPETVHGLRVVLVHGDMFQIAYVPGLPPNNTY